MILKNKNLIIEPGRPFANDELERLDSANVLTQFVISTDDPMVVCIDAPWGQGKTTFLRMWEQHLKDKAIPTIYFNSWENDFSDDALVSIIGEISSSVNEFNSTDGVNKARQCLSKAKDLGVSLIKRSVPVAAKVATAGVLDLDKITEQAISGFAESLAREEIESYEKSKKTLHHFRETLKDLAASFTTQGDPKPLVFIIDELDRCRPNFSIEILEKIKHFFNVDNIVFVLGADKEQLGYSIQSLYGEGLNVNGYLRRFIDFDYLLPPPKKGLFVKSLFNKFNFGSYFSEKNSRPVQYEHREALTMFSELFEVYNLTLREQEHCCSILSLAIRTTSNEQQLFPIFLCFMIVLKVKEPNVYKSFLVENLSPQIILDNLLSKNNAQTLLDTNYGAYLEAYIVTCKSELYTSDVDNILLNYKDVIDSTGKSQWQKTQAKKVSGILSMHDWQGSVDILNYLLKKIEIASRFNS